MDSNLLAGTGSKSTNIVKRHQRIKFMMLELDGKRSWILREVSFEEVKLLFRVPLRHHCRL